MEQPATKALSSYASKIATNCLPFAANFMRMSAAPIVRGGYSWNRVDGTKFDISFVRSDSCILRPSVGQRVKSEISAYRFCLESCTVWRPVVGMTYARAALGGAAPAAAVAADQGPQGKTVCGIGVFSAGVITVDTSGIAHEMIISVIGGPSACLWVYVPLC